MITTAHVAGECWRCGTTIQPGDEVRLVAGHTGYQHPDQCTNPLDVPLEHRQEVHTG